VPRLSTVSVEDLATPCYQDYFETLGQTSLPSMVTPGLPVETSRGCWWGQKSHCTFCGLNGGGIAYRSRSPDRVLEELRELNQTYGISKFELVDNILDMRHFDTLLPRLRDQGYSLFGETKSNLRREHVQALAEAGFTWIQPGIESLHSRVLALMDKGAQAWMNVELLKWSREFGLRLSWALLFGFPTENDMDYQVMAELVPRISHLQPPGGMLHIRYDRYSPYHTRAQAYGLDLVPGRLLKYVYPLSEADLMDQTYFFEDRNAVDLGRNLSAGSPLPRPGAEALRRALTDWSEKFWTSIPPVLCEEPAGEGLRILDTRGIAQDRLVTLGGAEAAILRFCDRARNAATLGKRLVQQGLFDGPEAAVASALKRLLDRGFVVELDGRIVSLTLKGDVPSLPHYWAFPGGFAFGRRPGTPPTTGSPPAKP
jgi:ribosomal peptide maturation radical SAM protein 1